MLFGVKLGLLPISGIRSMAYPYLSFWGKVLDLSKHLFLPVVISAFGGLAGLTRYVRTSMVDVLDQDYIMVARAKGLPESKVYFMGFQYILEEVTEEPERYSVVNLYS